MTAQLASVSDRILAHVEDDASAVRDSTILPRGTSEEPQVDGVQFDSGYLIIAARALGLDCDPMSGFDNAAVDQALFSGTRIQSNFICSIGHGKVGTPYSRNPRLTFEEAGWFA